MRYPKTLMALSLALALPAFGQTYSSSTNATTTVDGVTTSITGGTGDGTVSASGVVVNPQQDQELLNQVVSGLANDPAMAGAQIDVQVVGGRVTLNGIARGPAQAEQAKDLARGIAGGANVTSNLSTSRQ